MTTEKIMINGETHKLHIDVCTYIFEKCVRIVQLEDAMRKLRDAKGRYHTQLAAEALYKVIESK